VPAAFDHETQIMLAREIYGGGDIHRALGRDRIDARRRHPGVDPAGTFRRPDLVAEEERVAQIAQQLLTDRCVRNVGAGRKRRFDLDETAADRALELVSRSRIGPIGIARPYPSP
jgi:hypothetical protein